MNACDLFDPARLPERDEDGRLTHPDFSLVVFVEDEVDVTPFFNGAGLELHSVAHEWPEEDHDGVDLSWLTPEPPDGDNWRLVSIHDNEDGEAIAWWTRYTGPASYSARIVGARMIDGVHVIVARPASRLLPEQLLVRYDDYLAAVRSAAAPDPIFVCTRKGPSQRRYFPTHFQTTHEAAVLWNQLQAEDDPEGCKYSIVPIWRGTIAVDLSADDSAPAEQGAH